MTSRITNTITDTEWQDGDDSALWDDGYREGITKAITILDSVRQQPVS